jgi:response regulator NasT
VSAEAPAPATGLRVLAADEDVDALEGTIRRLEELGHDVTGRAVSIDEACELIARDEPDAAVVVVHEDPEHALDLIEELSEAFGGPVVAVHGADDPEFVEAAARRGIGAVTRSGAATELRAALEVAVRRHAEAAQLARQVDQLEHALERRAAIERAKGILMERHGLTERAAFERLRARARSESRTVVAVARELCGDGRTA